MESLMKSEAFSKVPNTAGIWLRDSSISGTMQGDAEYWQYVIAARVGKNLVVTPDLLKARAAPGGAYYLYIYDEPLTRNQYVLLAPLEPSTSDSVAIARRLYLFPNSPNPSVRVGGDLNCDHSTCVGEAIANDNPSSALFESSFVVS